MNVRRDSISYPEHNCICELALADNTILNTVLYYVYIFLTWGGPSETDT